MTSTPVTLETSETLTFLSTRWGEHLNEPDIHGPMSIEDYDAVDRLRPKLSGEWELSFVAKRDGRHGIVVEVEYDDGLLPSSGEMQETVAQFSKEFPELAAAGVRPEYTKGEHVFNERAALRVFVPESLIVDEQSTAALCKFCEGMLPVVTQEQAL